MTEDKSDTLIFFVNGRKVRVHSPDPEWTLLFYLRDKLRLTGTKLVCGEGGCGACTVMLSKLDPYRSKVVHMSVNACLMPLCAAHGVAVTTVEGIGSTNTRLHPIQERLAKSHGSQCGFCTPGIVMSMYALLRNNPLPSMQDVETFMQGNLCRCTGYRPILDGLRTLTAESRGCGAARCCQMKENCCQVKGHGGSSAHNLSSMESSSDISNGNGPSSSSGCVSDQNCNSTNNGNGCCNGKIGGNGSNGCSSGTGCGYKEEERIGTSLFSAEGFAPYDPSQESIFPPELMLKPDWLCGSLRFAGPRVTWYRPGSLSEMLRLLHLHPHAKIVNGNTEVGVEVKFKYCEYPVLIQPSHVTELHHVTWDENGVTFGAACTLSDIDRELQMAKAKHPEWKTRIFAAISEMLRWFAGTQIRNVSAIGGNIMTGSPISDLVPLLTSAGSQLTLMTSEGLKRVLPIRGFYTGYRRNRAQPREILLSVNVPFTAQNEFFMGYKQAHRRDDDIAIVNAGMFVRMREQTTSVEELRLTYGGMAATTVSAANVERQMAGREWNQSLLDSAVDLLLEELPLDPAAPGGMVDYRRALTVSFFFKFFLQTRAWLSGEVEPETGSVLEVFQRPAPAASQLFQVVPPDQPVEDLVGRPLAHVSAMKQVTGEAQYCDDILPLAGQLHAGLVLSARAHANIVSVDPELALSEDGVEFFFSAKDLSPERNQAGLFRDEEVFSSSTVTSMGQVIGVVLAGDHATAQRAARKVKVIYEDLPPIITIEDAIAAGSFFEVEHLYEHGDLEATLAGSDHVIEGRVRMGGQEHFYLEPTGCIAIPKEDNEMEIIASSQGLNNNQLAIAKALGVPANRIVCKAKRIGGGFGGKETRTNLLTTPIAVAANKSGRPVRAILDRDEDMISMGTRHPFLAHYRAGVSSDGKLTAVDLKLYSNGGHSVDLSYGVMSRATTHADNAYHYPVYRIHGRVCRTNTPSNTAFRGFGGSQGCFIGESIVDDVARTLQLDPVQVRRRNLYREAEPNITRQPMVGNNLQRCLDECLKRSEYERAHQEVEEFNRQNRWKKRGIAVNPNKYGIAFGLRLLNQGGALVHIYTDGSLLVTTGGIEMGQGLNTKIYQIVTRVLGVSVDQIYISESSTDKVPNASPSAASMSTDLYGAAVQNACEELWRRLAPAREAAPDASFADWVLATYNNRVCLSACGFEKTNGLTYDMTTKKGNMYAYQVYGAACSVVEVDCLTGDHQVLRTDIVMDIGESINPAIDIGQIEGAFMQGYGLFCMERLKYSPKGFNFTRGPGAYKIPGFGDIPLQLNVSLLRGSSNPRAVYSSKAVGEPPLFSGASVLFAVRRAVEAARREREVTTDLQLDSPATPDRVRLACQDQFTEKLPPAPKPASFIPWMVDL